MAIAWFTLSRLLAPLHRPTQRVSACARSARASAWAALETPAVHRARPARTLRVVRVVEASAPATAGRMVISGRLADVCAELDRLAAMEAAAS